MSRARIEVLVEPFKESAPGPHVAAAVDALGAAGLDPEMGPFATTAEGDLDDVLVAAAALLRESFEAGATAIQLRMERA